MGDLGKFSILAIVKMSGELNLGKDERYSNSMKWDFKELPTDTLKVLTQPVKTQLIQFSLSALQ